MSAESAPSLVSTPRRAAALFGVPLDSLPASEKSGPVDLTEFAQKYGFFPRSKGRRKTSVVSIFVTKGGVLKSTLTLNIARLAALHGVSTCVVGLDMQGDITSSLNESDAEEEESLSQALERISRQKGLADVFMRTAETRDVLLPTDLPSLWYIPETPGLVALDQSLLQRNRREYWLSESVIEPLKERFELILLDCSPNWNRLINNALVASDLLVSPVECRINHFRNIAMFRGMLDEFRSEMRMKIPQVFIPTRHIPARKLSREIVDWYTRELPGCSPLAVRETVQGEEATATRLSLPEYAPSSDYAAEMRQIVGWIWARAFGADEKSPSARKGGDGAWHSA